MPETSLPPDVVLRNYFHAKDENRPRLLEQVFTPDALLEIRNRTSTSAFPGVTRGREAIADVLIRSFGQAYENVYSFYLQRPTGMLPSFECQWIVAMTDKASRAVRLGCGSYAWAFDADPPKLACRLAIDIAEMQVLAPAAAGETFAALARLTYPWSSGAEVARAAKVHPVLRPIVGKLGTLVVAEPRAG
jgi:hypothetical protein